MFTIMYRSRGNFLSLYSSFGLGKHFKKGKMFTEENPPAMPAMAGRPWLVPAPCHPCQLFAARTGFLRKAL